MVCSMRPPPTAFRGSAASSVRPYKAWARVGSELQANVDAAGRQRRLRLLPELLHATERVGVLQLIVLDEEREAVEVVGLRHDHAFGAAVRDFELGADRVGVVVDPRDHARGDVLDIAVVGELRCSGIGGTTPKNPARAASGASGLWSSGAS